MAQFNFGQIILDAYGNARQQAQQEQALKLQNLKDTFSQGLDLKRTTHGIEMDRENLALNQAQSEREAERFGIDKGIALDNVRKQYTKFEPIDKHLAGLEGVPDLIKNSYPTPIAVGELEKNLGQDLWADPDSVQYMDFNQYDKFKNDLLAWKQHKDNVNLEKQRIAQSGADTSFRREQFEWQKSMTPLYMKQNSAKMGNVFENGKYKSVAPISFAVDKYENGKYIGQFKINKGDRTDWLNQGGNGVNYSLAPVVSAMANEKDKYDPNYYSMIDEGTYKNDFNNSIIRQTSGLQDKIQKLDVTAKRLNDAMNNNSVWTAGYEDAPSVMDKAFYDPDTDSYITGAEAMYKYGLIDKATYDNFMNYKEGKPTLHTYNPHNSPIDVVAGKYNDNFEALSNRIADKLRQLRETLNVNQTNFKR